MDQKVIQALHIYVLIIMNTGFMVHVLLLPNILTAAQRDAWISVIISVVPCIVWTLFIFYIYKKLDKEDIIAFLKKWSTPFVTNIFTIAFGVYFIINAFITVKFTVIWAKANYTHDIPNIMVVSLFTFICIFASYKGIRTISTLALLFLPFVTFFGIFVGLGNTTNKNYELLFPVFESGYRNTLNGILYTSTGYLEIIVFLFLTPYLKNKLKAKWLLLVGIILIMLTLGPLMGAIAEFGSVEAVKMRNPAYEQWKLLRFGYYITRLDFLSIFQWLSGAMIRTSLCLFIGYKLISNSKHQKWILLSLYLLVVIGTLIHWDATSFFYFIYKYFFPISGLFLLSAAIILLFLIIKKGKGKGETL
ncbi:endospore germination permease [Bacillus sp. ISL-34]|uniref:GerAB/ArcD/ProY family transporter n=1 Tax=Bacillus sp. ISL-34 TaxID=2819121 RepID=UPI001BEB9CC4|nr:endospore germination permease [Bacillus sp. ISL-34]MBT2648147.1 endospore germination permease [Bacillus sp. ISL-34]